MLERNVMVKQLCAVMIIFVAISTISLGQTRGRTTRQNIPKQKSAPVPDELNQLERQWHTALEKADLAMLDRLLAKEWFITNGSGTLISKSEVLEALRSGEIKFTSTVPSEIKVHVYNQAAVVTKRSTDQTMYGSNAGGGRYQMTDMFVRIDGRWQCVATHAS